MSEIVTYRSRSELANGTPERLEIAQAVETLRGAAPPLLIGGVDVSYKGIVGELLGARLDFLTQTVPDTSAEFLRSETELLEAGHGRPGFFKSERRTCLGGDCWRRWEPSGESLAFGRAYESWEWSGVAADVAARRLRGHAGYPSRLDWCWDFSVAPEVVPADVIALVEPWCLRNRITCDGRSGERGVFTHYIGSRNSERFIRIYRKDLQDPSVLFQCGPVLRVELVLKGDKAKPAWHEFDRDDSTLAKICASHVFEMTGFRMQCELLPLPEVLLPEVELSTMLFAFMKQWGSAVDACRASGIDLAELGRVAAASASPGVRRVWGKRREGWKGLDLQAVVDMVAERLRGSERMVSSVA